MVTSHATNQVLRLAAGVQETLPFSGLNGPNGVAVDGAGNVIVSDELSDQVLELAASGVQVALPFEGLNQPQGLALDAAGDIFVANIGTNVVKKLPKAPAHPAVATPSPRTGSTSILKPGSHTASPRGSLGPTVTTLALWGLLLASIFGLMVGLIVLLVRGSGQ